MFPVGAFQPMHLLLILAIVLVVFGAGKLGQVGGALGKSVKEFKSNVADEDDNQDKVVVGEEPVATESTTSVKVVRPTERPASSLRREEI